MHSSLQLVVKHLYNIILVPTAASVAIRIFAAAAPIMAMLPVSLLSAADSILELGDGGAAKAMDGASAQGGEWREEAVGNGFVTG